MKTMTCKQLGGACDLEFSANTFEEIAQLSKTHGGKMIQEGDQAHIDAMNNLMASLNTPEAMNHWMKSKMSEFNSLPNK